MKRLAFLTAFLGLAATAFADDPPPPPAAPAPPPADSTAPGMVPTTPPAVVAPAPTPVKTIGVGYKLGDGIGFFGGDIVINPLPHLALDLYGTYMTLKASDGETGAGFAIAPAVQGNLRDGQRSTPYVNVGLQYVHMTLGPAVASGTGMFANVGYEWKWRSGLGIQLGAGVQYLSKAQAMDGNTTITIGGALNPNLEFGIRYMFL